MEQPGNFIINAKWDDLSEDDKKEILSICQNLGNVIVSPIHYKIKWINCFERMPLDGQEVLGLLASGKPIILIFFEDDERHFRCDNDGYYLPVIHITHWAEITRPEQS